MFVERRKAARRNAFWLGRLFFHEAPRQLDCLVWDASRLGVLVEVEPAVDVPPRFRLVVTSQNIDRDCMAIWRDGRIVGVAFT